MQTLVQTFIETFGDRRLQAGITTGGFLIHVGSTYPMRGLFQRNVRVGLRLPPQNKFDEVIFNDNFLAFVERIKSFPERPDEYLVSDPANHVDVKISYRNNLQGVTTNFHTYTSATRVDRNPLYNALKEKADQLRKTLFDGLKGIIICDGGCRLLTTPMVSWNAFSTREIIQEFFRKNTSIAFVLTISIKQRTSLSSLHHQRVFPELALYTRTDAGSAIEQKLAQCIKRLCTHLPAIEGRPENVLKDMRYCRRGSFHGGYQMTDSSIRISARTLLELLAGKLSQKEFVHAHQFTRFNPFLRHLNCGELLKAARIIPANDEDDDWIEFSFGSADSAVVPFTVPSKACCENSKEQ